MSVGDEPKPLFWVGSMLKDLKKCPGGVQDVMGYALYLAQIGRKHPAAKPLKGFGGANVLEIVEDHEGGCTYRGVYAVKFAGAVYGLHVFKKKSKKQSKTPRHEIELIQQRLRAAKVHYEEWIADQEAEEADSHAPN
jgi:phage-related protein